MASAAYCMADGFEFSTGKYCCKVEFYSPTIVRVTKWPANKAFKEEKSLVVTMQPQQGLKVSRKENATSATLNCGNLAVKIDKRSGRLQFLGSGKNLLHEKSFKFEERTEGTDKGSYKVNQTYTLDKQEAIYGLGTIQDGKLNRRGTSIFMEQSICRIFSMCYNQLKAGEYTGIIIHVLSLTIMQKVCRSQPKWAMLSTIISCMAVRLMV